MLVLSVSAGQCQQRQIQYINIFFFSSECPTSHKMYFTDDSISEDGVAAAAVSSKQHRKPETLLTKDLQLLQNPVSFFFLLVFVCLLVCLFCFVFVFVFLLCSFEGEFISGSL